MQVTSALMNRLSFILPTAWVLSLATLAHAQSTPPAWVARSNELAQILIKAEASFVPEGFSMFGVPGYDDQVADLRLDSSKRFRAALAGAKAELQKKLAAERDVEVRQDLEILIDEATRSSESLEVSERLELPWIDVGKLVFQGIQSLLSEQVPPERRAKALDRLKRYVGQTPGSQPIAQAARQRLEERAKVASLLRPSKLEVDQALANAETYPRGIRKLFEQFKIAGAEQALAECDRQLGEYASWARSSVLPSARSETILPAELYALKLREVGIDIPPGVLLRRAQSAFIETRAALQALAPRVAKEKGLALTDYRDVIRALKKQTIPNDKLEKSYRSALDAIDPIIRREKLVDVPNRPMVMRLGSEAESAAQPAPHFQPAQLIGNTGQQGQFVLPTSNPTSAGKADAYDDFSFAAVRWTLSAHEGRPGHELQFSAMIERGVSLARSLFAFNSVNVEGWALYAEAELLPYEPLEGQLIALQFRLLRAARAMLDPMLNLGQIDRERAQRVLREDVVLSTAMQRQELDRYTFNAPGQAGSYFFGYSRILQLRAETELALGDKFDRLAFNNFLIGQGLLPPELLAKAVREQFIPAQLGPRASSDKPARPAGG